MTSHKIAIDGDKIWATSPEGRTRELTLEEFFRRATGSVDLNAVIPPAGVIQRVRGNIVIWIYQRPPQVFNFKWIAPDSPSPHGAGTAYRTIAIALPYVIVYAVFQSLNGGPILVHSNEAFFANAPIRTKDDPLCFPALLNCSMFRVQDGNPLAWICTQHLDMGFNREPDVNKRMNVGFRKLIQCLFETGFNYSSEHHEGMSGFTASQKVDERISTVEKWAEVSKANPLFPLDVPWLPTGFTVDGVTERIFTRNGAAKNAIKTTEDIARIIFSK